MDPINLFTKHFVELKYSDLPRDVVSITKIEVLDLLGVALAGITAPGVKELCDLIADWGGKEESSVFYSQQKVPVSVAAQANATMGHALDFDDVHDPAVLHPGVVAIPTCLAMSERIGNVNGRDFITAIALGVDMMGRMAMAVCPGYDATKPDEAKGGFQALRVKQGWHLTAVTGYFGAAGVAGRLLGLNEESMRNAFGIAYHECGGNLQCRTDGAHTKRLGPGFASRAGIVSALLAEKGVTGARNIIEGEHGFYNLYFRGGYDPKTLVTDLGAHFEGTNVSIKPYPCCRGTHAYIDAALALRERYGIDKDQIQHIDAYADEGGYNALCMPFEARVRPRNLVDSQFSIPWVIATAFAKGRAGVEHFTEEAIKDPEVLAITGKISVELDHGLDRSDAIPPARISVTMKNGENHSIQIDDPLGSPQRPMSFDDCARKFMDCATAVPERLPDDRLKRIVETVERLEELKDVATIAELMR